MAGGRGPTRTRDAVEMALDAGGRRADGGAARATPGVGADARTDRGARERGQSVPALAGGLLRGAGRASGGRRRPRRRLVLSSGPSDREAAVTNRGRGAAAARRRGRPHRGSRGVRSAELRALIGRSRLFVGGDTGPLHIAAATATPIVGIYRTDALGAVGAVARPPGRRRCRSSVAGLPCRPCDQRVCAPGDFRCLTTLMPDDGDSAAERALAHSMSATYDAGLVARRLASTRCRRCPPAPLERAACLALFGVRRGAAVLDCRGRHPARRWRRVLWLAMIVRNHERIEVPPMFWPLAAYAGRDARRVGLLGRPARQPGRFASSSSC